jgi:hypothetical protein
MCWGEATWQLLVRLPYGLYVKVDSEFYATER